MSEASWAAIKRLVYTRANGCCEYCQTCEDNTGQAMHVEHIDPNGENISDNLCLSCPNCNLSKATSISAIDPLTEERVPLFNPRLQGRTSIGRATVERLKMNQQHVVRARRNWIRAGNHPP